MAVNEVGTPTKQTGTTSESFHKLTGLKCFENRATQLRAELQPLLHAHQSMSILPCQLAVFYSPVMGHESIVFARIQDKL